VLAFDVFNLEEHRTLQKNAARLCLPEFRYSELSLIVRSLSSPKLSKLNRQIPRLEHPVIYRKQTTETWSNRQKLQKRLHPFSKSTSLLSARDSDSYTLRKLKTPARKNEPFLQSGCTTSNRKWPKSRCYRKQTIKPCLTEARTAFSQTAFQGNLQILAAALSQGFRPCPEATHVLSKSPNLSRFYGRS
jgi:hypothetical protein